MGHAVGIHSIMLKNENVLLLMILIMSNSHVTPTVQALFKSLSWSPAYGLDSLLRIYNGSTIELFCLLH